MLRISKLRGDLLHTRNENKALKEKAARLDAYASNLASSLKEIQRELLSANSSLCEYEALLSAAEYNYNTLEKSHAEQVEVNRQKQASIDLLTKKLSECQEENEDWFFQHENKRSERIATAQQSKLDRERLDQANAEADALRDELRSLQQMNNTTDVIQSSTTAKEDLTDDSAVSFSSLNSLFSTSTRSHYLSRSPKDVHPLPAVTRNALWNQDSPARNTRSAHWSSEAKEEEDDHVIPAMTPTGIPSPARITRSRRLSLFESTAYTHDSEEQEVIPFHAVRTDLPYVSSCPMQPAQSLSTSTSPKRRFIDTSNLLVFDSPAKSYRLQKERLSQIISLDESITKSVASSNTSSSTTSIVNNTVAGNEDTQHTRYSEASSSSMISLLRGLHHTTNEDASEQVSTSIVSEVPSRQSPAKRNVTSLVATMIDSPARNTRSSHNKRLTESSNGKHIKSIYNSGKKSSRSDGSPWPRKSVAFGSPEGAEYNLGSPSGSMTPIPHEKAKVVFNWPLLSAEKDFFEASCSSKSQKADGAEDRNTTTPPRLSLTKSPTTSSDSKSNGETEDNLTTMSLIPLEGSITALLANAQKPDFGQATTSCADDVRDTLQPVNLHRRSEHTSNRGLPLYFFENELLQIDLDDFSLGDLDAISNFDTVFDNDIVSVITEGITISETVISTANTQLSDTHKFTSKKQNHEGRRWLITINNYLVDGKPQLTKEFVFAGRTWIVSRMSAQYELGTEQTPHLHIYVQFASTIRFHVLVKHLRGIFGTQPNLQHVGNTAMDAYRAFHYCLKLDTRDCEPATCYSFNPPSTPGNSTVGSQSTKTRAARGSTTSKKSVVTELETARYALLH